MNDEDANRGGNAGQLRRAIHPRVINVEPGWHTTACDGLTQTIEHGIESLAGIELGVRDKAAGVVERGVEKNLHAATTRPLDPGTEQHVGLPDLIAELSFELLMGLMCEQLPFRQATMF
jgi:hypothetical protein